MAAELTVGGERLVLLPQRAASLPDHRLLLVADAHLGKAVAYRRLGVPVPRGTTRELLDRLALAVERTDARAIVFLGDLLHAPGSFAEATLAAFARWRRAHADLALTLVRGNHDQRAGDPPPDWGVQVVDGPLRLGGLALQHEPSALPDAYVLAGHLHPCAWVPGRGRDGLRLPAFHFGAQAGVLPAFGGFTGMHTMARAAGDRIFVVAADRVRELPVTTLGA